LGKREAGFEATNTTNKIMLGLLSKWKNHGGSKKVEYMMLKKEGGRILRNNKRRTNEG